MTSKSKHNAKIYESRMAEKVKSMQKDRDRLQAQLADNYDPKVYRRYNQILHHLNAKSGLLDGTWSQPKPHMEVFHMSKSTNEN